MSNDAPNVAAPKSRGNPQGSEGFADAAGPADVNRQGFTETKSTPEVGPQEVAGMPRTRGKQKEPRKQDIHIRLDNEIIEHFKRDGRGWQTRINDSLRRVIEVERSNAERKPPA